MHEFVVNADLFQAMFRLLTTTYSVKIQIENIIQNESNTLTLSKGCKYQINNVPLISFHLLGEIKLQIYKVKN